MLSIEADFFAERAQIQAESIGWIPLNEGAYLHLGSDEYSDNTIIEVVGLPKLEMQGSSVERASNWGFSLSTVAWEVDLRKAEDYNTDVKPFKLKN